MPHLHSLIWLRGSPRLEFEYDMEEGAEQDVSAAPRAGAGADARAALS